MSYKPRGMHAAAEGLESEVRDKGKTVRTLLPRGRKQFVPMLAHWDMVGPIKAVVMPGSHESPTEPRISRKQRVSPLTRIAEQLPAKLPVLQFCPKTQRRI
jgi:hypothetical protein